MIKLIKILILLIPFSAIAQEDYEIQTDSSCIEIRFFEGYNYTAEFNTLNDKTKTYYRQYVLNTKILQKECIFGYFGYIGTSYEYSPNGKIISKIDYDKGIILIVDTLNSTFLELKNRMKTKADSLLSKMYGASFLKNHTVWSIDGSSISNENESGNWIDNFKEKPTKFLFRYDVFLDKDHRYDDLIAFELDSNGHFIPNNFESAYGFENVDDSLKGKFKLKYEDAMSIAKDLGLSENDTIKAEGVLFWENFEKKELINGQFMFYIIIKTNTIENIVPNGRSSRTTKYDIYAFNPWTGEFSKKKKMKSIYFWENSHGLQTGLIPDN